MNSRLNYALAFSGILAAIVNTVLIAFLDIVTPNYNSIQQYVSEFGIIPGITSTIVSVWWICYGILLILFSISLNNSIDKCKRFSIIGPLFITLYGLLDSIGSSIFPIEAGGATETFYGMMHILVSFLGVTAIIFSPLALIPRLKSDRSWKELTRFSWITQLFFWIIYIICLFAFSGIYLADYLGLLQRIFIIAANVWIAVLSYYTIRHAGRTRLHLPNFEKANKTEEV